MLNTRTVVAFGVTCGLLVISLMGHLSCNVVPDRSKVVKVEQEGSQLYTAIATQALINVRNALYIMSYIASPIDRKIELSSQQDPADLKKTEEVKLVALKEYSAKELEPNNIFELTAKIFSNVGVGHAAANSEHDRYAIEFESRYASELTADRARIILVVSADVTTTILDKTTNTQVIIRLIDAEKTEDFDFYRYFHNPKAGDSNELVQQLIFDNLNQFYQKLAKYSVKTTGLTVSGNLELSQGEDNKMFKTTNLNWQNLHHKIVISSFEVESLAQQLKLKRVDLAGKAFKSKSGEEIGRLKIAAHNLTDKNQTFEVDYDFKYD